MTLVPTPSRAPYGREAKYAPPQAAAAPITTYYDQPQLKKSHWGARVALYIFIAGLSGGAQLIATWRISPAENNIAALCAAGGTSHCSGSFLVRHC
jgi:hypothetical protein